MAAALKSLFDAKHRGDQCTNCGHVVVRTPLKACMAALKQPCEPCGRRAGGANRQRGMAAAMKSLFDAKHPGDQCTNCGHVVVRTRRTPTS